MKDELMKGMEIEVRRQELDYRDLALDFEFVKDLNTQLSMKYEELLRAFPTKEELDIVIKSLGELYQDQELLNKRAFQLKRFRSALVMLEKQDHNVIPPKYEELLNDSEQDNKG